MGQNSDYIKEIENYFLSHAGKGIMLSSADYNLINDWKKRGIPKEVVFKGINRAIEKSIQRDGQSSSSIRNIKQCVRDIENLISEYAPVIGKMISTAQSDNTEIKHDSILEMLNGMISQAHNDLQKNYYRYIKESLVSSEDNNPVSLISGIEEKALESFFMNLDSNERELIAAQAREKLGSRARHMTETAIKESIISFRNEILTDKYNLRSIMSFTEGIYE